MWSDVSKMKTACLYRLPFYAILLFFFPEKYMFVIFSCLFRTGTLVKLHGAFMVGALMFAASLGILFACYFRLTCIGKQFMGKDIWFVVCYPRSI